MRKLHFLCIFVVACSLFNSLQAFAKPTTINANESTAKIIFDEKELALNGYNIDGYNYYSINDLNIIFMSNYRQSGNKITMYKPVRVTSEEIMKFNKDMNYSDTINLLGDTNLVGSGAILLEYAIENGFFVKINTTTSENGKEVLSQKTKERFFSMKNYTLPTEPYTYSRFYGELNDNNITQQKVEIDLNCRLYEDSKPIWITGYNINGETYLKIYDACKLFKSVVSYNKDLDAINILAYYPKKTTNSNILKITPDMTYNEIIELLGETIDVGYKKIILQYEIEDGYFVNITFPQIDKPCGLSGEQLLAKKFNVK